MISIHTQQAHLSVLDTVTGDLVTQFSGALGGEIEISPVGLYTSTDFEINLTFVVESGLTVIASQREAFGLQNSFMVSVDMDAGTGGELSLVIGASDGGGTSGLRTATVSMGAGGVNAVAGDIVVVTGTYNGSLIRIQGNAAIASKSLSSTMHISTHPITIGGLYYSDSFNSSETIWDVSIGGIGSANGAWHNTTWVDTIGSNDGTIIQPVTEVDKPT
jgi:hypothetical protein